MLVAMAWFPILEESVFRNVIRVPLTSQLVDGRAHPLACHKLVAGLILIVNIGVRNT